jgi:hypothetical protein
MERQQLNWSSSPGASNVWSAISPSEFISSDSRRLDSPREGKQCLFHKQLINVFFILFCEKSRIMWNHTAIGIKAHSKNKNDLKCTKPYHTSLTSTLVSGMTGATNASSGIYNKTWHFRADSFQTPIFDGHWYHRFSVFHECPYVLRAGQSTSSNKAVMPSYLTTMTLCKFSSLQVTGDEI